MSTVPEDLLVGLRRARSLPPYFSAERAALFAPPAPDLFVPPGPVPDRRPGSFAFRAPGDVVPGAQLLRGLFQTGLGAVVVLTTSTLNRVMVVELAMPAILPGALVAIHYALQVFRPAWGHGSDLGARRTPWIVGGMAVLATGGLMASVATAWTVTRPLPFSRSSVTGRGVGNWCWVMSLLGVVRPTRSCDGHLGRRG